MVFIVITANSVTYLLKSVEERGAFMKQKAIVGLYVGVVLIFVMLCVLSIFEVVRNTTLSDQLKNVKGTSSQTQQIKKLQTDLSNEQSSNSKLAAQFNELSSKYQTLQSNYDNLQAQINKIQSTKAKLHIKTVYLTFDDGPSRTTPHVLDVLKENNIHATFFVVGTAACENPEIVKRAYNEGNVIGIHSWTHKYEYIYQNEENFFLDFNKLKDFLTDLLGVEPNVCRFPGGTNNTVSQKYSDHIMRKIAPRVAEMGIKDFDWNSYAGDGERIAPTREQVISNVLNGIAGKNNVVVLFHDTNPNNCDVQALPEIISRLKALGYSFDVLSPDTPSVTFKPV
jgi:peptidoglycan/xylan/chitin deacetylase (PgdA/CDA1 family)